ncbi:MAG: hypothetical protein R6X25_12460 [Candidatus Krumholzibacteriia bacterium]
MLLRIFLLWLPMVPLAIVNAAIRERTYRRRTSELRAHQISSITAILLFGIYVWAVYPWLELDADPEARLVGMWWAGFTVLFELLFGRYAMRHSWARLGHDYDLRAGRIWVLVVIWVGVAPYVFYHWLG